MKSLIFEGIKKYMKERGGDENTIIEHYLLNKK